MFNKKVSSRRKRILFLFFIVSVLIIFSNIFQKRLRNFSYVVSSPLQKILWQAGDKTANFFGTFVGMKEKEKIRELEKENQKLITEIAALKDLKNENKILRNALGVGLQKDFKLSLAQIIGKDISQDFILINKGAEDGILKDMPVITSQKILLGKISRTYKNFSKVMLLSNKKMSFDVNIQSSSADISGVGKGKGNSKILIGLIPREEDILKGDLVVSGSLGGIFPKGLFVGRIKKVEKKDTEAFQKIEIEPAFNIGKLDGLFIQPQFLFPA